MATCSRDFEEIISTASSLSVHAGLPLGRARRSAAAKLRQTPVMVYVETARRDCEIGRLASVRDRAQNPFRRLLLDQSTIFLHRNLALSDPIAIWRTSSSDKLLAAEVLRSDDDIRNISPWRRFSRSMTGDRLRRHGHAAIRLSRSTRTLRSPMTS